MPECNREYYAARAEKARLLARTVQDPVIAAIHLRMAASYAELVDLIPDQPPKLHVVDRSDEVFHPSSTNPSSNDRPSLSFDS